MMALNIKSKYTDNADAASLDYPTGSFRNDSTPSSEDGTPLEKDWANDFLGARDAVLAAGGVTPSGIPDTAQASDFLTALRKAVGNIIQTTITDSNPTWTPDTKTKMILFDIRGGGGAGGGVDGQGAGTAGCGAAGGDGARVIKLVKTISPSYSLIVGDGGLASDGVAGTDGGDTSVVDNDTGAFVNISAGGGKGGVEMTATSGNRVATASAGGDASGGDINIDGSYGSGASVVGGYPAMLSVASSVASVWSGNGTVSSGVDAINYGCGGSGAVAESNSADPEGGFGKQGVIYITEYQ